MTFRSHILKKQDADDQKRKLNCLIFLGPILNNRALETGDFSQSEASSLTFDQSEVYFTTFDQSESSILTYRPIIDTCGPFLASLIGLRTGVRVDKEEIAFSEIKKISEERKSAFVRFVLSQISRRCSGKLYVLSGPEQGGLVFR